MFFYQNVLKLENDQFVFEIRQVESSKDLFKNKKDFRKSAKVTHRVTMYTKAGIQVEPSAFFEAAFFLRKFLTFVRGGYVGIGHMMGVDDVDKVEFALLGFNKFDDFALPSGWFDIEQYQELPGLFSKFTTLHKRKDDREIVRNCIGFL